jgi:pimeloyl-ACP methyl ester carboxylesterase
MMLLHHGGPFEARILARDDRVGLQTRAMLFARQYGDSGPLVILLHGGPGASGHMAPVARGVADSCRLIEPFQRRSGGGPLSVARHVEDLHELVNFHAPDASAALLGSSWGAMLALAYAAAHPTSVASLVLVGCGTFDIASRTKLHETLQHRMNDEIRERLDRAAQLPDEDRRLKAVADALTTLYAYDPLALPEDDVVDARAHRETWDDMLHSQEKGVYPAAFASVKIPVLMAHGSFDPHPGHLIRTTLWSYLPQLDYRELKRCGHWPWLERFASAEFFSIVRQWLERNGTRNRRIRKFS